MKNTLLAFLTIIMLAPAAALAQTSAVDLTSTFVAGGITIDRLLVLKIGGIVLIRGRTDDPAMAAHAGSFAVDHGYLRVANLIEVVPAIGDAGIERLARYQLEMAHELMDCRFQVNAASGIVHLRGQVANDSQRIFALRLVARIDGVKEVQSALTLPLPIVR
jgi:osmotically-inducible protein OsmY